VPVLALVLVLAQPAPLAAAEQAARAEFDRQRLVGLAVGLIVDGTVALTRGYGHADREAGTPVDPAGTQFRWASCSKPVTAVAALQLAEAGKLNLDADVRALVPEFPDKGVTITARQLLCHQGGIVHYGNGPVVPTRREYDDPHPFRSAILALDRFNRSPLVNRPGERFAYTTHGYMLLSAVVERAGGKPFAEQVAERIARPLGLVGFRPDYHWEDIPHRAVGYVRSGDDIRRRADAAAPDVSWKLGGGGFTSPAADFARFAAGLAAGTLVSADTASRMWTAQPTADGTPTTYGLGFTVAGSGPGLRVGHTGAQEKTRTAFLVEPQARRAVVVMTNSEYGKPDEVARRVLAAMPAATR
jgi:CubicO group peptidase (beta-lactamase class C family)